jgi:hypothetical protein
VNPGSILGRREKSREKAQLVIEWHEYKTTRFIRLSGIGREEEECNASEN